MGFKGFTPKTQSVQFPGGEFAVRGLAPEDFSVLLRDHYDTMAALFEQYVSEAALVKMDVETSGGRLRLGDMRSVVMGALDQAPALMGDTIARAADETENPKSARTLPMGVQLDALGKIVTLTLEAEGGVEKLTETISMLATNMASVVANRSP
jgi:hypothetical protein